MNIASSAERKAVLPNADPADLRRHAITKGKWRALRLALVLPSAVAVVALSTAAGVIDPLEDLFTALFALIVCLGLLLLAGIEIYYAFSKQHPLVIQGKLLGKSGFSIMKDMEGFPPELMLLRVVSGRDFEICVSRATRIHSDGSTSEDPKMLGKQTLSVTRPVYRAVERGNETLLLCTPAERAVAILRAPIGRVPSGNQPTSG